MRILADGSIRINTKIDKKRCRTGNGRTKKIR
nr:MAG TPA: hypothetical protein [Caudoviricetes sp.]